MELENYKNFIKNERNSYFASDTPYDLVYRHFQQQGFFEKDSHFFHENASNIVEIIRESTWNYFQKKERAFTSEMLNSLYSEDDISTFTNTEAIQWFVHEFPTHIYQLSLSNTQSRRSRAGKEFEAIIELILIGAAIPLDSQSIIGKKTFSSKGLGKSVDLVSPGAIEYSLNKRDTLLISAKTTLRERWQEVPEEMERTGAREMFLVTLDNSITNDVISTLNEANIQLVTTNRLKQSHYANQHNVISFEKLISILKETAEKWNNFTYPESIKREIIESLQIQINKHHSHPFVHNYYQSLLHSFSNTNLRYTSSN